MRSPKDASRAGAKPDGDWSHRARNSSRALGGGSRNCALLNSAIDLRRAPERHFLERFNVLNPVAHLVAELKEQRPTADSVRQRSRVASLIRQRSASSVWVMHHARSSWASFTGVVGAAMKALFARKAKLVGRFKGGGLL